MIEIDDGILVETEHLGSNNGIIRTDEGLVLVDAPHRPTDAVRWRSTVDGLGPTTYLINTDHHPDHTMCNAFLPGTIVSHAMTRDRLLHNPPTRAYLDDLLAVIDPEAPPLMAGYHQRLPTLTYEGAMQIELGGLRLELTHVPGHTPNNTLVYLPQRQVLFTGDLICEAGLPAFIEADIFACIEAVRRIEAMDVRLIVPGHGKVCGPDGARAFREQIEGLLQRVTDAVRRGETKERVMDTLAYEDRIHVSTGGSPAYPDHLIDLFMRGSLAKVYDQVAARAGLARQA